MFGHFGFVSAEHAAADSNSDDAGVMVTSFRAGLAWLASLARRQVMSAEDRELIRNVKRLARLSPHLLDDIGLLPEATKSPMATLQDDLRRIDKARAEAAKYPTRRPADWQRVVTA